MLCVVAAGGVRTLALAQERIMPIQLHVDLFVAPSREEEMIQNFHTVFEPVIAQQPGFVAVKMLKLRSVLGGEKPTEANYRLLISFKTEEQRLAWVATDDHQRVWPEIAKTLTGPKLIVLLYDEV
jgi:heme-degrading monooxygenase HmoA